MATPEAIIISGDLIEGVKIGEQAYEEAILKQYEVTGQLLNDLCERFLDGDKRRMILTPGNHDVCWNTARQAMTCVSETEYPSNVYASLIQPNSNYRWSWTERKLLRIFDDTKYEQRMDGYWNFVEAFYEDAELQYDIERDRGFQLFELCDRRILIASFDSTHGNDCFSHAGAVAPGIVGSCAMRLREVSHDYDLKVALWHHSIQGPPLRSDYMDASQIQEMIGHGFQLGLHGHQHLAGTLTQYVHLDESKAMAVVSAGSLCAGVNQLPRGQNRQYNVIEIMEDFVSARVHVREMGDGDQFTRKKSGAFNKGFVDISWFAQTNAMGMRVNTKDANDRQSIGAAEVALRRGRPAEAIELLSAVDVDSYSHARRILLDALQSEERWRNIIEAVGSPRSTDEAILLVTALIRSGRFDEAQAKLYADKTIDIGVRKELQELLSTQQLMRKS